MHICSINWSISCSFQVVLAFLQSCQIFMLSGIPVESQQVCTPCDLPSFWCSSSSWCWIGTLHCDRFKFVGSMVYWPCKHDRTKCCSLGDFLGHGPKCTYSLSISHPHSKSWSWYIPFPWLEGGVSRRTMQRPDEKRNKGKKMVSWWWKKFEKICTLNLWNIWQPSAAAGKTTFLHSNDKKQVHQCIKFLNVALTNEGKHTLAKFKHDCSTPSKTPILLVYQYRVMPTFCKKICIYLINFQQMLESNLCSVRDI